MKIYNITLICLLFSILIASCSIKCNSELNIPNITGCYGEIVSYQLENDKYKNIRWSTGDTSETLFFIVKKDTLLSVEATDYNNCLHKCSFYILLFPEQDVCDSIFNANTKDVVLLNN